MFVFILDINMNVFIIVFFNLIISVLNSFYDMGKILWILIRVGVLFIMVVVIVIIVMKCVLVYRKKIL